MRGPIDHSIKAIASSEIKLKFKKMLPLVG